MSLLVTSVLSGGKAGMTDMFTKAVILNEVKGFLPPDEIPRHFIA